MSVKIWLIVLVCSLFAVMARAQTIQGDIILWGPFSSTQGLELFKAEVQKKTSSGYVPQATIVPFSMPPKLNPFAVSSEDFERGNYLATAGKKSEPAPLISETDAQWFKEMDRQGVCPKFFMIAGHQVISHGWHNHAETRFMFLPSLFAAIQKYPEARRVLSCVKVAILFGCNTMTNLEAHGPDGSLYSPEEAREIYLKDKSAIIGTPLANNTLEFYRSRLAREYGPNNPQGHFDYYRDATRAQVTKEFQVRGKTHDVENVDATMPDEGLFDGSRRYNYPYLMKRLFPNASLVLGFSSASPANPVATGILKAALDRSRSEINGSLPTTSPDYIQNLLYPLADDKTPVAVKEQYIRFIRKNWSLMTNLMNRGRPAGSVTPAFPQIDQDGIIPADARARIKFNNAASYGPYENSVTLKRY